MTEPLRLLTVCTHNRTRSVLIGALLVDHLAGRGVVASLDTGGFREEGMPATPSTVQLLAERGIDVAAHRSRRITPVLVSDAHLILTAEHQQVVRVATMADGAFERTFTLPELVDRLEGATGHGLPAVLAAAAFERETGAAYLEAAVPEVLDPTGKPPPVWRAVLADLDDWCVRLADAIAPGGAR